MRCLCIGRMSICIYIRLMIHFLPHDSPDLEVRRKALRIALEMTSTRNVQDVVLFLKKELAKTHDQEYEKVTVSASFLEPAIELLLILHCSTLTPLLLPARLVSFSFSRTTSTANCSFNPFTRALSNSQKSLQMLFMFSWSS